MTSETVAEEAPRLKGYIVSPRLGDEALLMTTLGFDLVAKVAEADVVMFTGGADIDPWYYKDQALDCTRFDEARDRREFNVWKNLRPEVIKIGICRGAQLLCALHGGKLWQDVTNHATGESGHWMNLVSKDYSNAWGNVKVERVNSYHHQAMRILPKGWEVVGLSAEATRKLAPSISTRDNYDVELAVSMEDRVYAIQSHPEFRDNETRAMFYKTFKVFKDKLDAYDADPKNKRPF